MSFGLNLSDGYFDKNVLYEDVMVPIISKLKIVEEKDVLLVDENNLVNDILLELVIPSINLKEYVYNIDSYLNDVDFSVELLDGTSLENNLFVLAAHSGDSKVSFFREINQLKKGDLVYIYLKEKDLSYVVDDIYYIDKNGMMWMDDEEVNFLYLITCSEEYLEKQLVVKCKYV